MQVNNSTSNFQIQPFGQAPKQPSRVADERSKSEQNTQQQRVDRIDADKSAITLLEQEKRSNNNNTSYDQPSQRNNTAVQTYQAVGNIEQRENVQQLLGVDIFA